MSMTTDKPPADGLDDGFARHSRRALAAGAVLVLAAAGAVWALTTGGSDKPTAEAAAYESACGLTGGSTATPTTGPEVQWQNVGGSWLPVSTTQGPGSRSATGPWTCFAHTPTGAVLAAWAIPARMTSAQDFAAVVKQQTLPGAGQTARLKKGPGSGTSGELPTPIGFTVNGYDDRTATVTVYTRQLGVNLRCPSVVEWVGGAKGDWLLRLTPDGGVWPSCERLPDNLTGIDFVAWGPNT